MLKINGMVEWQEVGKNLYSSFPAKVVQYHVGEGGKPALLLPEIEKGC